MRTLVQAQAGLQKPGGLAALSMAMAYLIAMPYFLLVVDATYLFGLLQIVWLVWLGIVMLGTTERKGAQMVPNTEPTPTSGGEGAAAAA